MAWGVTWGWHGDGLGSSGSVSSMEPLSYDSVGILQTK